MTPHIPDTAPFTPAQRAWLNGYMAGLFSTQEIGTAAGDTRPARPLSILYGSQTGTAEGLARKAAKHFSGQGFAPSTAALDEVDPAALAGEAPVLVIASTYGDGEMPDNAQLFWEALVQDDAPRLDAAPFAVLALGDASYPDFCQAGKDLDAQLEALGARRLHPRIDCDVDVDEPFTAWLDGVTEALCAAADVAADDRTGDGALQEAQLVAA